MDEGSRGGVRAWLAAALSILWLAMIPAWVTHRLWLSWLGVDLSTQVQVLGANGLPAMVARQPDLPVGSVDTAFAAVFILLTLLGRPAGAPRTLLAFVNEAALAIVVLAWASQRIWLGALGYDQSTDFEPDPLGLQGKSLFGWRKREPDLPEDALKLGFHAAMWLLGWPVLRRWDRTKPAEATIPDPPPPAVPGHETPAADLVRRLVVGGLVGFAGILGLLIFTALTGWRP